MNVHTQTAPTQSSATRMQVMQRSRWVRRIGMVLACGLLHACAHQNALLQSPVASTTDSIDQMHSELGQATRQVKAAPPVPEAVMQALTPQLDGGFASLPPEARFDLSVNQLPAQDFFGSLVDGTALNIVVHPAVSGSISLSLKDVSVEDVLEITRDIYGYDYEKHGNLYKVYPSGLSTRIFEINYLNVSRKGDSETRVASGQITANSNNNGSSSSGNRSSSGMSNSGGGSTQKTTSGTKINTSSESNFWTTLAQTLQMIIGDEEGRSVVVTPDAGMVLVRAGSEELAAVEAYLRGAELIMQRQVIIEAKILEVDLNKGYQQGIDWTFSQVERVDAFGEITRGFGMSQDGGTVSTTAGGIFSGVINFDKFSTAIDLLGTQGNVQVLSSPRVSTVNNQKAVIKVGSDEYFVTDINFESDNESDTSSTDIDLTPFFSGIALDVTPQISAEGKIILHVHPTISKVEDQQKLIAVGGQDIELPLAFSTIRESDSVITAENGQIVVLGGLIQNRSEDENSSVPFFGDLPLIGEMFKQKSNSANKTELVILLKPTVTTDKTIQDDIGASRQRFDQHRKTLKEAPNTSFYD